MPKKIILMVSYLMNTYGKNGKLKYEFKHFISSTFFETKESREVMYAMFEYIITNYSSPIDKNDNLDPQIFLENIHKILGMEKYTTLKKDKTKVVEYVKQIATGLQTLIKKYIFIKSTEQKREISLLRFYKNNYSSFESEYISLREKLKDDMEKFEIKNYTYYQKMYEIEMIHLDVITLLENTKPEAHLQQIGNVANYLMISGSCQIMNLQCLMLNAQLTNSPKNACPNTAENNTKTLNDSNLQSFIKHNSQHPPVLQVYYHATSMLQNPDEQQHFVDFKDSFFAHKNIFDPQERKNFYKYLNNYCSLKIKDKQEEEFYRKAGFQILKERFDSNEDEIIDPIIFKNILTLSIQFQEFDFLNTFIQKIETEKRLPSNMASKILNFGKAFYAFFCKKDDTETDKYISNILSDSKFGDTYFELAIRRLKIKVWIQQILKKHGSAYNKPNPKELDSFQNYLISFEKFVRNKKLSLIDTQKNLNFKKSVEHLFNSKEQQNKEEKYLATKKLSEMILKTDFFKIDLIWLKEKNKVALHHT